MIYILIRDWSDASYLSVKEHQKLEEARNDPSLENTVLHQREYGSRIP